MQIFKKLTQTSGLCPTAKFGPAPRNRTPKLLEESDPKKAYDISGIIKSVTSIVFHC